MAQATRTTKIQADQSRFVITDNGTSKERECRVSIS